MPYSRPQLKLLLLLALTLLAGLGVREWRAGFPDLAERIERFDREEPVAPPVAPPAPERRRASSAARIAASAKMTRAEAVERDASPPGEDGAATVGVDSSSRTSAPPDPRPLDINRASLGELARLPGVGQSLAARILTERERRGRFDSPEALRYVLGMGPKKLAAIREMVTVVAGQADAAPATPPAADAIAATPPPGGSP